MRPPSERPDEAEIDRLLARLRGHVEDLRRLEQASRDQRNLNTGRQRIAELHWQLARLVRNHSRAVWPKGAR
jgi:hypothetical protein